MSERLGKVLLYRGTGVIPRAIQWQTRSAYSHAALLSPDGNTVIEAREFVGTRMRPFEGRDVADLDIFDVAGMTAEQWQTAWHFAANEVHEGCRYDYRSIFRFLTRTKGGSKDRWFCSELVFAALEAARVKLLRAQAWAVAPGHLYLSMRLFQEARS